MRIVWRVENALGPCNQPAILDLRRAAFLEIGRHAFPTSRPGYYTAWPSPNGCARHSHNPTAKRRHAPQSKIAPSRAPTDMATVLRVLRAPRGVAPCARVDRRRIIFRTRRALHTARRGNGEASLISGQVIIAAFASMMRRAMHGMPPLLAMLQQRLAFLFSQTTPLVHDSCFHVCCSRFSVPGLYWHVLFTL